MSLFSHYSLCLVAASFRQNRCFRANASATLLMRMFFKMFFDAFTTITLLMQPDYANTQCGKFYAVVFSLSASHNNSSTYHIIVSRRTYTCYQDPFHNKLFSLFQFQYSCIPSLSPSFSTQICIPRQPFPVIFHSPLTLDRVNVFKIPTMT